MKFQLLTGAPLLVITVSIGVLGIIVVAGLTKLLKKSFSKNKPQSKPEYVYMSLITGNLIVMDKKADPYPRTYEYLGEL